MGTRGRQSKADKATPLPAGVTPIRKPMASDPPRELGFHGRELWNLISGEYRVESGAARELLCQSCQTLDRAEACGEQIAKDGLMLNGKDNPLVKHEIQARAFVARTLLRLELEL